MQKEKSEKTPSVGSMHKRQVVMADGHRYLIYYTFGNENAVADASKGNSNATLPESKAENASVEESKTNV